MGNQTAKQALLPELIKLEGRKSTQKEETWKQHGWNYSKCSKNISLSSNSVTAVRNKNTSSNDAVLAKVGYETGMHVWEIVWPHKNRGDRAMIGIALEEEDVIGNEEVLIGNSSVSFGWDIVNKQAWHKGMLIKDYPHMDDGTMIIPETVVVTFNADDGILQFSSDERDYGIAFSGLNYVQGKRFFPAISTNHPEAEVSIHYLGNSDSVKAWESAWEQSLTFEDDARVDFDNVHRTATLKQNDKVSLATCRSIHPWETFEIQIENTGSGDTTQISIGLTTDPNSIDSKSRQETTYKFCDQVVLRNGVEQDMFNSDLKRLRNNYKLTLKRAESGELMFFVNGSLQNTIDIDNEIPWYGFVMLWKKGTQISITDTDYDSDNKGVVGKLPRADVMMERMQRTLRRMAKLDIDKIDSIHKEVKETFHDAYYLMHNKLHRQLTARMLASFEAARTFTKYLAFLEKRMDKSNREHWEFLTVIRTVCWDYSACSVELGKELAKQGFVKKLIKELETDFTFYKTDKGMPLCSKEQFGCIYTSAFGILFNCSPVPEKEVFRRFDAIKHLKTYLDPDKYPPIIVALSLFTMCNIHESRQVEQLKASPKVIEYLLKTLDMALEERSHTHDRLRAMDIVLGLTTLSLHKPNRDIVLGKNGTLYFLKMIKKGDESEKECALNAIWYYTYGAQALAIAQTPELLDILEDLKKSNKNPSVQEAAQRALDKIFSTLQSLSKPKSTPSSRTSVTRKCDYQALCNDFVATLNIPRPYYSTQYDKCICADCHNGRGDPMKKPRGVPEKDSSVPVGWANYGLQVPPKAEAMKVFDRWHRAFHGTVPDKVQKILEVGYLVPAGSEVIGGEGVKERVGHFNSVYKPKGFDTKMVYVSPSIRYAGANAYASPCKYNAKNGKTYQARVALQVVMDPGSYQVGPQTLGAKTPIDPYFSNEELEWFTKQHGSNILISLLVKLTEGDK